MKNKIKNLWKNYKFEIVCSGMALTGLGLLAWSFRSAMSTSRLIDSMFAGQTVINEGVKHTYQLGGEASPLKYDLTQELADAYNRVGEAIANAKGKFVKTDVNDMAAWNYVAKMTNEYLKDHTVANEEVLHHFLNRI